MTDSDTDSAVILAARQLHELRTDCAALVELLKRARAENAELMERIAVLQAELDETRLVMSLGERVEEA